MHKQKDTKESPTPHFRMICETSLPVNVAMATSLDSFKRGMDNLMEVNFNQWLSALMVVWASMFRDAMIQYWYLGHNSRDKLPTLAPDVLFPRSTW